MQPYNRLPHTRSTSTIQSLYNSALVRYKRGDPTGAADTIRNCAKNLDSQANFYKLEGTPGTIEDALAAWAGNKPKLTLKILKHLSLQFHCGKLVA